MRVTLSARVSTHDQHTRAMQIDAMRTCATRRGWTVTDAIEAWALMPQRTAQAPGAAQSGSATPARGHAGVEARPLVCVDSINATG
jgi:hypothetical protein